MKFFKGLFIFLIVIVVLAALLIGGFLLITGMPARTVETEWTEADYDSYIEKGGIVFPENQASMEDMMAGNFIAKGQVPVDTVVTSAELTAIANKTINQNSIMEDVNIKCNSDGTIEISAVVGDLDPIINAFPELDRYKSVLNLIKNKPVYMKSTLEYNKAAGEFDGTMQDLYVGMVRVPIDTVMDGLKDAGTAGNDAVKQLEGFSVNDFAVTGDGFDFDGTIPETIESAGELAGF